MSHKTIIGVMGGGEAPREDIEIAEKLGELIAARGWILLNGGRRAGIMQASAKGAKQMGGLTIGILPGVKASTKDLSEYIDIPIYTGMGIARNAINILSSDVVIACTGNEGTASEVAMALKCEKPVIFLGFDDGSIFLRGAEPKNIFVVSTPEEAVNKAGEILTNKGK